MFNEIFKKYFFLSAEYSFFYLCLQYLCDKMTRKNALLRIAVSQLRFVKCNHGGRMEIELKYFIPDTDIIDKMWRESVFQRYGDVDSREEIDMKAVYYDTEDGILGNIDTVFGVRQEGSHRVATLKWNGVQHGSLYEREELNITIPESMACASILSAFAESEKGREIIQLIENRPLKEMVKTDYTRRIMRIDTGSAICEASLDTGRILTESGDADICELELELFSGDMEDIKEIGCDLKERFGLLPAEDSKYGRGLHLLKNGSKRRV